MQALGQIPRLLVVQLGPMRPLKIQLIVVKGLPMDVNLGANFWRITTLTYPSPRRSWYKTRKEFPYMFGLVVVHPLPPLSILFNSSQEA